ncbi:MAG: polysaccharide deacetylase family protein [Myxococcota bacterium]
MAVTAVVRSRLKELKETFRPAIYDVFSRRPMRDVICWRFNQRDAPQHVSLTYDDGPHPEYTPQVLDALAAGSARATFFVLGSHIEKWPDLFKRTVDEGHDIGIHGYVHNNEAMGEQTERTMAIVKEFGVTPRIVRPPYGYLHVSTGLWMVRNRFTTVMWSFDCLDSMRHEGKVPERHSLDQIQPGDIVLLHDDNPVCVQDTIEIVELLRRRNLQTRVVSEMLRG